MMEFKEFVKEVADKIKEFLPDAFIEAEVKVNEVTKNNGVKLTGLTIHNEGSNISPTIYMESFYEKYADQGMDLNSILQEIAKVRVEHDVKHEFDASSITDFEKVHDHIMCKLINRDLNNEYLKDKPFTPIEDLAVVYLIDLGENKDGHMTTAVTDKLMDEYGITTAELHDIAMDNLSRADIVFKTMWETLIDLNTALSVFDNEDIKTEMDKSPMYVLTIRDSACGAASVLDQATMDTIAERIGSDYVVIPSSVNEVIVVPYNGAMSLDDMNNMVREVNSTELTEQDILSDHVYMYDTKEHELVSAQTYEDRYADKTTFKDIVSEITSVKEEILTDFSDASKPAGSHTLTGMSSVKDMLSDKTAEVAMKEAIREHPIKMKDAPVLS